MNPRGRFAPKSLTALPHQYRTPACIYAASIILHQIRGFGIKVACTERR